MRSNAFSDVRPIFFSRSSNGTQIPSFGGQTLHCFRSRWSACTTPTLEQSSRELSLHARRTMGRRRRWEQRNLENPTSQESQTNQENLANQATMKVYHKQGQTKQTKKLIYHFQAKVESQTGLENLVNRENQESQENLESQGSLENLTSLESLRSHQFVLMSPSRMSQREWRKSSKV